MKPSLLLSSLLVAAMLLAAPGIRAQSRNLDLGSIFDTAKSLVKSQSVGAMSEEEEAFVGKEVVAATLGSYPPIRDPGLQHRLNQIGVWIALQSSRPELPWRFAAVESETINAFAAPGGTILVTRGMLGHVTNEAELACVLGHEIGHVTRRHHIAVLQKSLLVSAGASALSATAKAGGSEEYRRLLIGESKEIFTRRLDVAVAITEGDVQTFVGMGVPETELTIVLRSMEGAGRQTQRQGREALEEQAALGNCVISEESGHE